MFEQLPATIPHKDNRKLEAFGAAIALQAVIVAALIIIQMAMPEKLGEFQLITTLYMAPPPPPPAAPLSAAPEPVHRAAPKTPATAAVTETAPVVQERALPIEREPAVIAPTTIPKDIAHIVESPPASGGVNGACLAASVVECLQALMEASSAGSSAVRRQRRHPARRQPSRFGLEAMSSPRSLSTSNSRNILRLQRRPELKAWSSLRRLLPPTVLWKKSKSFQARRCWVRLQLKRSLIGSTNQHI